MADTEEPGGYIPWSDHYPKSELARIAPHEQSDDTPYGLPWWAALLIFGKSQPIPDDYVSHAKWRWYEEYDELSRGNLIKKAEKDLNGLRSSTGDILSRIAVIAVVAALGIQPVQSLLVGKHTARTNFAWATLALIGVAILCLVIIVTPKLKVWARQRPFVGKLPAMLDLMEDEDVMGWQRYLRLTRKIEHRKQLIRFERRLQVVAGVAVVISMITLAFSLALH